MKIIKFLKSKSTAYLLLSICSFISLKAQAIFSDEIVTDPALLNSIVQLGNNDFNCTGFLIDEFTIVTAAHCVTDETGEKNPKSIYGFSGKGDAITSVIPIGFTSSSKTSLVGEDIAIVFPVSDGVKKPFPNAVPLEIEDARNLSSADDICVAGVGGSKNLDGVQSLKIRCGLRFSPAAGGVAFVDDPGKKDQTTGEGDSGGPVLKKLANGKYKVVGIINRGPKAGFEFLGLDTIATDLTSNGPGKIWLLKKWVPTVFSPGK